MPQSNYSIAQFPDDPMLKHVDLVGVLFIIWGLLTALVGVSTLALAVGALALLGSTPGGSSQVAAGVTVAAFIVLAAMALVWGAGHIVVGVPLRQRRPWSRHAALVLGAVDMVLLPYGTALGCYALWALLSEEGRKLFEVRYS
jgi:hypothetical protein